MKPYRLQYYNKAFSQRYEIEFDALGEAVVTANQVDLLPEIEDVHLYHVEEMDFK